MAEPTVAPRAVVWEGLDELRLEVAFVAIATSSLAARGSQLGVDPVPYRLSYELTTGPGFETEALLVESEGAGWRRGLRLRRHPDRTWSAEREAWGEVDLPPPATEVPDLAAAVDCDLGRSPLTNTLPVLRLGLLRPSAQSADLVMAWVSVPDLDVHRSEQRYVPVSSDGDHVTIRYEGRHRDFVGDLVFTGDGLVQHYPELARRRPGPADRRPPPRPC